MSGALPERRSGTIRRLFRWLWRWAGRFALLGAAVLAVTVVAVLSEETRMLNEHLDGAGMPEVDAIVVLGGGIDGDGVIGFSSRRRVAAAVAAWRSGKARVLIMSGTGSIITRGRSSAAIMADHAAALGVPRSALIVEGRARSTLENLRFSFEIAEREGLSRLAIASDAMHLARADALAAWLGRPGLPLVAAAGRDREGWSLESWATVREALAWWFNLGKVALWEAMDLAGYDEAERAGVVH